MNKHNILSDEELRMLLSNEEDKDSKVESNKPLDTPYPPRSMRHRKKKRWIQSLFK